MYDIKALYEATSVDNAIELLTKHSDALIIAGGSDLLIEIRDGKLSGCELVSIQKLDELRGVELLDDGTIKILPLTSFTQIAENNIINKHFPVLALAVENIGSPQIRNIGTIGGNIANGVTSADSASTLLAFDAELEVKGPSGVRNVYLKDFYKGPGKVDLAQNEILSAILVKNISYTGYYGHYIKFAIRGAMEIATLGCSANVKLSDDKTSFEDVRIAYGVAGPVPLRATTAQSIAKGAKVSDETIKKICDAALEDVKPRTSWRASKEFRIQLVSELLERALRECIKKAGGKVSE